MTSAEKGQAAKIVQRGVDKERRQSQSTEKTPRSEQRVASRCSSGKITDVLFRSAAFNHVLLYSAK